MTAAAAGGVAIQTARSAIRQTRPVPRRLRSILALDDLEIAGRRHLPRPIFGFVAGGAETGTSLAGSRAAYADWRLVPRTLVDTSGRGQATTLFGQTYAAPFGIAPMGGSALAAFRGDVMLAAAAAAARVPFILSASSLIPLEEVFQANPAAWFQAYLPGEPGRILPLLDRVAGAGFQTLVLTVDLPVPGNRENNVRNGFSMPLQPGLRLVWDGLLRPSWLLGTAMRTLLRTGMPHFENMDATRGPPILSRNLIRDVGRRDGLTWEHIGLMRNCWSGRLVIKGILAPEDARLAREHGVDGVIVSNHGGRQLDTAIAPLHALPAVAAAAGDMAVMVDGGIRRGTDVLKAFALGAQFVFVGRPFLFAAALAGVDGVEHAARLLSEEVDRNMALLGILHPADMQRSLMASLSSLQRGV